MKPSGAPPMVATSCVGSGKSVSGRGSGTRGEASVGSRARGRVRSSENCSRSTNRRPCAVCHDLPDRRFHKRGRKLVFKTACHLADRSHFSPRPDLLQGGSNVGKGGKALTPGMQEDQIVVAKSGERPLRPNPENTSLQACQVARSLRFGEVAIPPFVILHARLGNEQFS